MKRQLHPLRALALACLCALLLAGARPVDFPDVPSGSWYAQPVTEMAAKGLISGYPSGKFGPGDSITAAQFVAVTARCAGLRPAPGQTGHWAAGDRQAALQAGWYDWDEIPPTGEQFNRPSSRQLATSPVKTAASCSRVSCRMAPVLSYWAQLSPRVKLTLSGGTSPRRMR